MSDILNFLPLVSVIVPNYNYSNYLNQCIDSILSQDYPRIEIIVVDDGSTDDSLEVLKKYANEVKVISTSNCGVNHARNLGLDASLGEMVAFCDSDDWWEASKISSQVNVLLGNIDLSLVYCGISIESRNSVEINYLRPIYRGATKSIILRFPARAVVQGGSSSALIRKSVLISSGIRWNESLRLPAEDINFFNKIALTSIIDFVDNPLVNYRQHGDSRSKMKVEDFIKGNRESFLDFSKFASEYVGRVSLFKTWLRLNLLLTKCAVRDRKWILAFTQLRYSLMYHSSSR